jgi:nucleotide-binding universal stress UspA family protein
MSSRTRSTRPARQSHVDQPGPSAPRLIGVGVDGSASGEDAVVLGSLLARPSRAELMLIAVHEEPLVQVVLPTGMSWRTVHEQARAMLVKTRDSLAPDARIAVQADTLVWRALRHVARREHRDLLVVGSGRRAEVGHVALGKAMSELLCHLECPLALAPLGMRNRSDLQLARIGVGFDGSSESKQALTFAASIALAADAELEVVGAVDDRVPGGLRTEQVVLEGDAIVAKQALSLFEREVAAVRDTGARMRAEVTAGNPVVPLRTLGARVDLLVIGSSRLGPAGRVSLGRTGKSIVGGAPCPVVVIPSGSR